MHQRAREKYDQQNPPSPKEEEPAKAKAAALSTIKEGESPELKVDKQDTNPTIPPYLDKNTNVDVVEVARTVSKLNLKGTQLDDLLKIIIDTGATKTMSGTLALFSKIQYYQHQNKVVVLGDGTTMLHAKGVGTIDFTTSTGVRIVLHDVIYVPGLNDTLLSVSDHLKYRDCQLYGGGNRIYLCYPNTVLEADITTEVMLKVTPTPKSSKVPAAFNSSFAALAETAPPAFIFDINGDIDGLKKNYHQCVKKLSQQHERR